MEVPLKPLRAHPLNVDGKTLWVPKSVSKKTTIVDTDTGEVLLRGYWVPEWWVRKNPDRAKMLRRSSLDYKNDRPKLGPNHKAV